MHRRLLLVPALVLAACAGSTTSTTSPTTTTTTTSRAPSSTSAAAAESPTSTPDTSEPTTTAPTSTTATTLLDGIPAIRIDEIVFAGDPYLVIANRGNGVGSTAGFWICQFPSYYELPAVELEPGERLAVPLGAGTVPDLVGVVARADAQYPIGTVSAADGEIGLYLDNRFNSADAIVDYVEWGQSGHARSSVAIEAAIWEPGGFVEVPAEMLAIVAQAFPTVGPGDWYAEIGG